MNEFNYNTRKSHGRLSFSISWTSKKLKYKMVNIILIFLLFLLPFIVGNFGISFYESPKILAAQLAIDALIVYAFINLKNVKKYRPHFFDICLAGIFLLTFFQILFNPTPLSFYGNEFRKQGIVLVWHLIACTFVVSKTQITIPPNHTLLRYIPHLAFFLLFLTTFFFGTTPDGRAVGVFGEPNSLGLYAAFLWPFVHILASPFAFFIILLSGSRSAFIAFGIQLLYLLLVKKLKIKTKVAVGVCIAIIAGSLYLPFLEQGGDYQNRAVIWQTAFHAGLEKPLLGHGFGTTELAIKDASFQLENNIRFEYIDSGHNIFLDWFIQGGLVGVLLLGTLIAIAIHHRVSSKNTDAFEIASFLGLLTGLMFNPVSVSILVCFFFLLGHFMKKTV